MKVVIASLMNDRFLNSLRAEFPEVDFCAAATTEEQKRQIKDADVYMGMPSREVFLEADHLRWLHCPGTGIDMLASIPEMVDSDVVLTNAQGPHTNPMADHAFGMIIGFAHHLREMWGDQKEHRWHTRKYDGRILELTGSVMGILALGGIGRAVALGGIGRAVARRAYGFGMEVYAVDERPMQPPPEVKAVWGTDRLDDLLHMSDWFVVAAPFTSATKSLLDRRRLGLMKPGAHLIVLSRGGIVDEEALVEALRSGRLAGAGLDVTAVEPLPASSALWDMENVMISPHASALTPQMWEGRREIFKENLRRFLSNRPFLYVCDKRAGY